MTIGYKWTIRKNDRKIFYITLECYNEFPDLYDYAYYSTDCVVKRIEDDDGNTVQEIDGIAFFHYRYYVGQHINNGDKIYYYHDFSILKYFTRLLSEAEEQTSKRKDCTL